MRKEIKKRDGEKIKGKLNKDREKILREIKTWEKRRGKKEKIKR